MLNFRKIRVIFATKTENTKVKQSIIPKDYIKVGRISMTIAHEAHIKAADIVVTQNYLNHVDNVHKSQLDPLGLSAFDFFDFQRKNAKIDKK